MRNEGGGLDPLLGDRLEAQVEGRRDTQAAALESLACRRIRIAQERGQLVADGPHEMGREPVGRDLAGEQDFVALGVRKSWAVYCVPDIGRAALSEQVQHRIAPSDDRRVGSGTISLAARAVRVLGHAVVHSSTALRTRS